MGSSESPIVWGGSATGLLRLWEEKMGVERDFDNEAMKKGRELEPVARSWFSDYIGEPFWPEVVESKRYPFLAASLDGASMDGRFIWECKCPTSRRILEQAESGNILLDHYVQIQHQLLVKERAEKAYYQIYFSDEDSHVFEVERDKSFEATYIPKAEAFWDCVVRKVPPIPERNDEAYIEMEDSLVQILDREAELKGELKLLEVSKKGYLERMEELCGGVSSMGRRLIFRKTKRAGTIDYKAVPELIGVDLEAYRKEDVVYWSIDRR